MMILTFSVHFAQWEGGKRIPLLCYWARSECWAIGPTRRHCSNGATRLCQVSPFIDVNCTSCRSCEIIAALMILEASNPTHKFRIIFDLQVLRSWPLASDPNCKLASGKHKYVSIYEIYKNSRLYGSRNWSFTRIDLRRWRACDDVKAVLDAPSRKSITSLFMMCFFPMFLISIVVDDVDGDDTSNSCHESCSSNSVNHLPHGQQLVFFINSPADGGLQMDNDVFGDDNADARSDVSYGSKSSRGSTSREESESRLQQIKVNIIIWINLLFLFWWSWKYLGVGKCFFLSSLFTEYWRIRCGNKFSVLNNLRGLRTEL